MSTSHETTKAAKEAEPSLIRDIINLARYYISVAISRVRPHLGGRRGFILIAAVFLGSGAALSWNWLVAIGLAPILLAAAPCIAMCALGLCMNGGGDSCKTQGASSDGDAAKQSLSAASAGGRPVGSRDEHTEDPDDGTDADSGSFSAPDAESATEHVAAESSAGLSAIPDERVDEVEKGNADTTRNEAITERS